jgi:hypothetical protein
MLITAERGPARQLAPGLPWLLGAGSGSRGTIRRSLGHSPSRRLGREMERNGIPGAVQCTRGYVGSAAE